MKKFFIALIGGTVLLLGVAMLVLPDRGCRSSQRAWRYWRRNSYGRGRLGEKPESLRLAYGANPVCAPGCGARKHA